ncbi:agglutinin-like [Salvia miltiorrhiza]|uniref:agglutinin-like n=1 Tax=Salvia miltiorrhiza TaxID=226208 RepID=UPI0025ACED91|nr:agglutinin-like [Salvia miltiorrhiza]
MHTYSTKLGEFVQEKECSCVGEIALGPWGCHSDTARQWSYKPEGGAIKKIIIGCGWIIDSLMFKADDYSAKFGGHGGDAFPRIRIDYPSEFLIGISGTFGKVEHMEPDNVCTLTFHTNKNQYGPFGTKPGPTPFSLIANGAAVTGFHGRCGQYVEAIGLYVKPLSIQLKKQPSENASSCVPRFLLPPRSAAAMGGSGGRDWDDGVFAAVKGVHACVRVDTGALSAVRFSYLKSDGSAFLSPFHGGYCEGDVHLKEFSISKMIVFCEEDEYLIGVEGFNGVAAEGLNVVTALSFMTNKGRYGPVGAEIGTYFTSMNSGGCNRKVVGFHGRSGAYLDAIGLHTEYF